MRPCFSTTRCWSSLRLKAPSTAASISGSTRSPVSASDSLVRRAHWPVIGWPAGVFADGVEASVACAEIVALALAVGVSKRSAAASVAEPPSGLLDRVSKG